MASLLLHAISASELADRAPSGLRGHPLLRVGHGELWAFASSLEVPVAPFGRDHLLEHHALVSRLDELLEGVLPARFPTWFADEAALRAELDRRHVDLVDALGRVRGRSELALTAVWTSPPDDQSPPEAATPGRKYMLGRQHALTAADQRRERAQMLSRETERLIGDDLVDVRRQICPSATVALSLALLVRRENAEKIKARLVRAEQDVRILVNGPWPPYTFATVV